MKILTSYALKKNEIESSYKPDNSILKFSVNSFPYISYYDLYNDIDYKSKNYSSPKFAKNYIKVFSSYLINLKISTKATIGILPGSITNYRLLFKLSRKYKIIVLDDLIIQSDHLNDQLKLLSNCIKEIFNKLFYDSDPYTMIQLINNHIIAKLKEGDNYKNVDLLLAGSMGRLLAAKYGAHMRNLDKPIISIMHGEGDQLMFDEPFFGYSDRTNCSHHFGFGNNYYDSSKSSFLKSLYKEPKYISSSSNYIRKLFSNKKISVSDNFQSLRWLYAPDSLLHHRRFGPFSGSIPASLYMDWQKTVMGLFKTIIYKKHPKGHSLFKNLSNEKLCSILKINKRNISNDNFYEVYSDFDGYIFDHISTAFMIAASTNKPIIYFNIGKRNFTNTAKDSIKNRCLWIDVDPANPIDLEQKIGLITNKIFSNDITSGFSLDKRDLDTTREMKLFKTIKSTL